MTISLCMIVRDEEEVIGRCLESVKSLVDEIMILDTGSTDRTMEIAKLFGAKIFQEPWRDDFSAARNSVFQKATQDFILWLDADDYITPENLEILMKLKDTLSDEIDSVNLHYSIQRDKSGETIYSLRRNRIVRRECAFKWIGRVHEYLDVKGNVMLSEAMIHHGKCKMPSNRNLKIYEQMIATGEDFSGRDTYYYANELYLNKHFDEAIAWYKKSLNNSTLWEEDRKSATAQLVQCYKSQGKHSESIKVILDCFCVATPRADLCCFLGECFMDQMRYEQAAFWYKVAMKCTVPMDDASFHLKEYYTWIPSIQLSVCLTQLGKYQEAYTYCEESEKYFKGVGSLRPQKEFLLSKISQ